MRVSDRRASNWLLAGSDIPCSASRTPPSARTFSPYRSSLTAEVLGRTYLPDMFFDNRIEKP